MSQMLSFVSPPQRCEISLFYIIAAELEEHHCKIKLAWFDITVL